MHGHVSKLCQTLNQLRNIARIRRYLDKDTCHHVVRPLVLSRLDYTLSPFLLGLLKSILTKLQRLQNSADRLGYDINRREHTTLYLLQLICTGWHFGSELIEDLHHHLPIGSSTPYLQNDIHGIYTTSNSCNLHSSFCY